MTDAEEAGWQMAQAVSTFARGLRTAREAGGRAPRPPSWEQVCEWAETVVRSPAFGGLGCRWVSDDASEAGSFEDPEGRQVGWLRLDRDRNELEWGPEPPPQPAATIGERPPGELRSFEQYLYDEVSTAVESIPAQTAADVYVVSLLVYDEEDDPRLPTVTVGFNTETRVRETTPAPGQAPQWPIASDHGEARWNYAFWLQNELKIVSDSQRDPVGAALRQEWISSLDLWYSDDEEAASWEAVEARAARITAEFVRLTVAVVQRLHASGLIETAFGRTVPVLIHELEYYEEIASQNEEANPPGVADEFARWVRGFG